MGKKVVKTRQYHFFDKQHYPTLILHYYSGCAVLIGIYKDYKKFWQAKVRIGSFFDKQYYPTLYYTITLWLCTFDKIHYEKKFTKLV